MCKKIISIIFVLLLGGSSFTLTKVHVAETLTFYTPYTGLSVTPGETITYNVDIINDGNAIQNVTFQTKGLPKDWQRSIIAGGHSVKQLSVRPGSEEQITVEVTIPLKIKKADYTFDLIANGNGGASSSLPFLINVSEEGT